MKSSYFVLAGVAGFALSLAAPAHAGSNSPAAIGEKDVVSGKVKLDPASGYILVSGSTRQFMMFLRLPDDESRNAWEKDRQVAFAKEHKRWDSAMASWRNEVQLAEQSKAKPPAPPVEPKIETFVNDPLELRDVAGFGPMSVYAKGETISDLERVKPGTYIWYGNVMGGYGLPAGGICMCMGSIRFEVKPGVVTNLGNALQTLPRVTEDNDVQRVEAKKAAEKRAAAGKDPVSPMDFGPPLYPIPATLTGWPTVQPEFYASPKMNNYFGVLVSRLSPIPGVLGYHRDVVVDERTGQELASPTLVSRQKPKL